VETNLEEIMTVAQTALDTVNNSQLNQSSEPSGIYVVMWVTLIVWIGLFSYLFYLDRQIKKVKNKIEIEKEGIGQ
jgi:CcmD family protein